METFVHCLFESGYKKISVFDSSIADNSIKDARVIRESSWKDCINNADCVIFGAAHDDIQAISIMEIANSMTPGGLVYDGRRYFSQDEINELKLLGIDYQGIGRSSIRDSI